MVHPTADQDEARKLPYTPEQDRWEKITGELLSWFSNGFQRFEWNEEDVRAASYAAFAHGIGPWLYTKYRSHPEFSGLPEPFIAALAHQWEGNQKRAERLRAEASLIFSTAGAYGIHMIPLKGIVLSESYYPSPDLRPMADIDHLVQPADIDRCMGMMADLGYHATDTTWKHATFERPGSHQVADFTAESPDNPLRVEIHTRVAQVFWGLTCDLTARLWRSAYLSPFLDTEAMRLPTGDTFLTVTVHAAANILTKRGGRGRILQLLDVAQVAKALTEQDEWNDVTEGWGASFLRFAYPAIGFTARFIPNAIAESVLAQIKVQVPHRLTRWTAGASFGSLTYAGNVSNTLQAITYMPRLARHPLEFVSMFFNSLLPPRWYLYERYPHMNRSLWPLAYLRLNLERLLQIGGKGWRRCT